MCVCVCWCRLSTILQISKKAGKLLKPHIPALVVTLLEAVSGLEPQVLNYLSFHTSSETTQDQVGLEGVSRGGLHDLICTLCSRKSFA